MRERKDHSLEQVAQPGIKENVARILAELPKGVELVAAARVQRSKSEFELALEQQEAYSIYFGNSICPM